jgi:hypothetical protein
MLPPYTPGRIGETGEKGANPAEPVDFPSRTIPAQSVNSRTIPALGGTIENAKCLAYNTTGCNWGTDLAWGARGPEFKSRRPDHLLCSVCLIYPSGPSFSQDPPLNLPTNISLLRSYRHLHQLVEHGRLLRRLALVIAQRVPGQSGSAWTP